MLRWIGNALASSVGRKLVVGLSGLLLVAFLVEHLIGNVTLYLDSSGEAFNAYVHFLKQFGSLLYVAELGLALLFACHIVLAIRLTLENRQARLQRYVVRNNRGAQTFGSVSMFVTGALLLGYLFKHMLDFRLDARFEADPAALVKATLAQPTHGLIYVGASILIGIHLSHGFQSAFQTFGLRHPKLDPLLVIVGRGLAVLFALGFASFPLYYLFFWNEGAQA